MLQTNLIHLMTDSDLTKIISEDENVMVCCGRMGPMCVPVYSAMESLKGKYTNVKFADMEFNNPESHAIRNDPACSGFNGLPFTVYYKNGKLVHATTSIQTLEQITEVINSEFSETISNDQ